MLYLEKEIITATHPEFGLPGDYFDDEVIGYISTEICNEISLQDADGIAARLETDRVLPFYMAGKSLLIATTGQIDASKYNKPANIADMIWINMAEAQFLRLLARLANVLDNKQRRN